MNGLQIQFLTGIVGILWSVTYVNSTVTVDKFKLILGIVLLLTAVFGLTILK
jgi:hypothetical protein